MEEYIVQCLCWGLIIWLSTLVIRRLPTVLKYILNFLCACSLLAFLMNDFLEGTNFTEPHIDVLSLKATVAYGNHS